MIVVREHCVTRVVTGGTIYGTWRSRSDFILYLVTVREVVEVNCSVLEVFYCQYINDGKPLKV